MDLVLYQTQSGHTEQVARAMAEVLGAPAQNVRDVSQPVEAGRLFLGGGIYAGKPNAELLEKLPLIAPERVGQVILFSTSLVGVDPLPTIRRLLEEKGVPVEKRYFSCKGQFLFVSRGHPDAADLEAARAFARSFLPKAAKGADKF